MTIGKAYRFKVLATDYDGRIEDEVTIHATSYSEALQVLVDHDLVFVAFLGEL